MELEVINQVELVMIFILHNAKIQQLYSVVKHPYENHKPNYLPAHEHGYSARHRSSIIIQ